MHCIRCGGANPQGARYCAFCGTEIPLLDQTQPLPGPATPTPTPPTSVPPSQPDGAISASVPGAQSAATAPSHVPEPAAGQPADPLAVASLVLAIAGPFTAGIGSAVSLVLGIVSLRRIGAQGAGRGGRGLALAGAIVSGATLGLVLLTTAVGFPLWLRSSRQRNCLSHVKQLGTGLLAYCSDYDGQFPLAYNWCDGLDPYVPGRHTYVCPSVGGDRNCYTLYDGVPGTHEAQWAYPAETQMLFESQPGWNQVGPVDAAYPRHRGGAHIGYLDGHAAWRELPLGGVPVAEGREGEAAARDRTGPLTLTKEIVRDFMASMKDKKVERILDGVVDDLGAEDDEDPEAIKQALEQAATSAELDEAVKAHGFGSAGEWVQVSKRVLPGLVMAMTTVLAEELGVKEGSEEYKQMRDESEFKAFIEAFGAPSEEEVEMIADVLKEEIEGEGGTTE